jgi:hypothetical protein
MLAPAVATGAADKGRTNMIQRRRAGDWSRRLTLGVLVSLSLVAGVIGAPPAQAAPEPAAPSDVVGNPPLPEYPGLTARPPSLAAVATTPVPCDGNGTDKALTRSEVVSRARSWLAVDVPYSQARCYRNAYGDYRTDCSGFISMAWGLGGSGSAWWTGNLDQRSTPIARSALKPGDALLRHENNPDVDHVALFVEWADSAHTMPRVIEQTGSADTVERTWSSGTASNYTPVRYDNILDDRSGGHAYHQLRRADGSWTGFSSLALGAVSKVATAADPSGRTHALAVQNGGVWHRLRNADGSWTGWSLVSSPGATAVAASSDDGGNLHVTIAAGGHAYHLIRMAGDGSWTPWGSLGSPNGAITAVSVAVDTVRSIAHVSVVAAGGQVWHRVRNTNGSWTGWGSVGNPGSGVAIATATDPAGALHMLAAL